MHTETVIAIIKMIEQQAENERLELEIKFPGYTVQNKSLLKLRNHLQGFIEAELNTVENQSAEQ